MKKILFILVSIILITGSCKKTEIIPASNKHFVVVNENRDITIELTWAVDGYTNGSEYLNCDLYLSDTAKMTTAKFVEYTESSYANDWANSPVFLASVSEYASREKVYLGNYKPYMVEGIRNYLGIAVNGLGPKGGSLAPTVTINYQFKIKGGLDGDKVIEGSFLYNTNLHQSTFVKYIYSLDWSSLYDYSYSFRELIPTIDVLRLSDYSYVNQVNLSSGYNSGVFVTMDWMVNGNTDGHTYIDLDLSATENNTGNTYKSNSGTTTESFWLYTYSNSTSYSVFYSYYQDRGAASSLTKPLSIDCRYVVYNWMNPFQRYLKTINFSSPPITPDAGATMYPGLSMNRSGSVLVIN